MNDAIDPDLRVQIKTAALEAQQACLDLFDAADADSLDMVALRLMELTRKVRDLNDQLRVPALNRLMDITAATGIQFGDPL